MSSEPDAKVGDVGAQRRSSRAGAAGKPLNRIRRNAAPVTRSGLFGSAQPNALRLAGRSYRKAWGLDAYLTGPGDLLDQLRRPPLLRLAVLRWLEVEKHRAGKEARETRKCLTELRQVVPLDL